MSRNTMEFIRPVFKFLTNEHLDLLLTKGNVHLPTLEEFRDTNRYKGTLHDLHEGCLNFDNTYTWYQGLAKNANGILPMMKHPYETVSLVNANLKLEISAQNLHIFCATEFFFSDSLHWAIGEEKEACALIINVGEFVNQVSKSTDKLKLFSSGTCNYKGREVVETNPDSNSMTNYLLSNMNQVAFLKPEKYAAQREFRIVWHRHENSDDSKAININIPNVSKLCIPVDFSNVDKNLLLETDSNTSFNTGAKVVRKGGKKAATYNIGQPKEIFCPIIHRANSKEPWYLGFYYNGDKTVSDSTFDSADIGVIMGEDHRNIYCNVKLTDIERLEFFHVANNS